MAKVYFARQNNDLLQEARLRGSLTYWGLLYSAPCDKPMKVRIPLHLGRSVARTLDDLNTDRWIPVGAHYKQCLDLEDNRVLVESGSSTEPTFTVYYCNRRTPPAYYRPVNELISGIANRKWYGNVLVVCHGKRNAVAGVQTTHIEYITEQIKLITEHLLPQSFNDIRSPPQRVAQFVPATESGTPS
ncbi:uncharacterized protein LACBIDRAFT_331760 [Laccaria bicolor S238N-H82]|uniref:Predicted protein n=1 Tax=Laccaria bicolor (strain S238N-H82 / ATCC MYA-4686) TaxID=486041 RepID=B0DQG7_LACBS|nr:uncharacterized protein LACBIDRAFT_331760 [Laccaria bicolor S238N-H82]EDR03035.1 predicted protein [Laccaria bicolor S238N-H82]|eukprot:XP_001886176.1 predicted protein [Laccaria bicolor S238N-H82]